MTYFVASFGKMHKNNFDFMRLMFAVFVIITHSYSLTGLPEDDWLNKLTGHQLSLSSLGVKGFFIISGYLIFQSAMRCRNWGDYMARRVLRIYPAFAMVLVVAAMVGLLVTNRSVHDYITSSSPYTYITTNLAMFIHGRDSIDGVFEQNTFKNSINGSLWTIPYEFFFYILLSTVFLVKRSPKILAGLVVFAYLALFAFTVRYEDSNILGTLLGDIDWHVPAHLGLFFAAGSVLAVLHIERLPYRKWCLLASLLLVVVLMALRQFYFSQFLVLPLVIILAGILSTKGIAGLSGKIGDWSYGTYLYGFLVQQTIMHYYQCTAPQLMFLAIPISLLLGALSWHLLEKRALRLKRYFP